MVVEKKWKQENTRVQKQKKNEKGNETNAVGVVGGGQKSGVKKVSPENAHFVINHSVL